MQEHATDEGVFIRSMASRGHLGGLSWPDAAGAAGARRGRLRRRPPRDRRRRASREVEIAGAADTTLVLLAPGMGDGIQAAKAGILEIGDVFVVNKADRDGADATVRDLRHMIALGENPERGWRPRGQDRRLAGEGVDRSWPRSTSTGPGCGLRRARGRRVRRARDEIEALAVATLRAGGPPARPSGWSRPPTTWSPGAPTRTPPPTGSWATPRSSNAVSNAVGIEFEVRRGTRSASRSREYPCHCSWTCTRSTAA